MQCFCLFCLGGSLLEICPCFTVQDVLAVFFFCLHNLRADQIQRRCRDWRRGAVKECTKSDHDLLHQIFVIHVESEDSAESWNNLQI